MRRSCLPLGLAMLVLGCANSHAPTDAAARSDDAELRDDRPARVDAGEGTGDLDSDGDGLSDAEELALGTSRTRADTDGDLVSDLLEHYADTDPLDPSEDPRTEGVPAFQIGCSPSTEEAIVRFVLDADVLPAPADLRLSFAAIDPEATRFFDSLEAAPDAPGCASALVPFDADADGSSEGLRGVSPGETACWRARASNGGPRECIYETLLLRGELVVRRGDVELDARRILFIVRDVYCPIGTTCAG